TRRCETVSGIPIPPSDVVAAMIWGQVRRVVVDSAGVVINMGRRRRLFTGNARQAVLLQSSRCVVNGCAAPIRRCEADHLTEWGRHGHTDGANGAAVCGRHNRLKNSGYRIHRDQHGFWHTYRPDGTEIH
ncbi:MAG TPA: HNH endonuclease signature motif containing protein, partial [Ilumatobacteraceae bacterium]|nr:HNH endonuclease signature motif containing protein [Ilumatobacteraceae bacterium]